MEISKPPEASPAIAEFIARQRAAAEGKYTCFGPCKQVGKLTDAVAVHWGGALVIAICPDCFGEVNVLMQRATEGIRVTLEQRGVIIVTGGS